MITYKEFQIKVMTDVFKKKAQNEFEPSLYMLTKEDRNKIGPLPMEIFDQRDVIANICREMNKLAGSKYCCFVSECNFTKVNEDQCNKIGLDYDKLNADNMTIDDIEKLRSIAIDAVVFNFESLTDDSHINLFKNVNGHYLPAEDINQDKDVEEMSSVFSNLLCK